MAPPQHRRCEALILGAWFTSAMVMPVCAFLQPSYQSIQPKLADVDQNAIRHNYVALNEKPGSTMEGGGMILAGDKNLLNTAFSSLDDKDKYETVLTGLCAKVIDGGSSSAKEGLIDPIRLIEEMNSSRIVAGPRSIISLIDVSVIDSYMLFVRVVSSNINVMQPLHKNKGNCDGVRCTYYGKSTIPCD
jgi:hypothetical protein